jgi:GDP/UDP-N,N'-diacetylbacillosamine 2-epimerase (hydrolysing)
MKKICVITGTRAEYGLLYPLLKKIKTDLQVRLCIAVTGSHLSTEYGLTYQSIINDGFEIDKKIDILLSSDTKTAVCKSMGLAMIGFGEYFEENIFDLIIVLGDRFEILAAVSAACVIGTPVAHLHGGELTEGAYDEFFRHSITKMSLLHFTSTEEYRNRVIQLGEEPQRVFNVGAIGIENIKNIALLTREELEKAIDINLDSKYGLVTFHPVTLENNNVESQIKELLMALSSFPDMIFIITKANADNGGRIINKIIDEFVSRNNKFYAFTSLGQLRYLSAMRHAEVIIGNSSSGIIEAPAFHKPVVNIGERQKGRISSTAVLHCKAEYKAIKNTVDYALSEDFLKIAKESKNPYGDGEVSEKIIHEIKRYLSTNETMNKKQFYDLPRRDAYE